MKYISSPSSGSTPSETGERDVQAIPESAEGEDGGCEEITPHQRGPDDFRDALIAELYQDRQQNLYPACTLLLRSMQEGWTAPERWET